MRLNLTNSTVLLAMLGSATVASAASFGTQELNRKHGFFLSGGSLSALSNGASQASAGWHTPLLPGLRWGLHITGLANKVNAPEGAKGGISYYHLGPTLTYQPFTWGPLSTGVTAGGGAGRVGYRMEEDNEYKSSGARTYFGLVSADFDPNEKLRLSAGYRYQKTSGVSLPGLSDGKFSGGDAYLSITTYR